MVYASGVRSDGNYRRDGQEQQFEPPNERYPEHYEEKGGILDGLGSIFKRLGSDDLILIGLGLVLLLDGNKDNDLLLIVLLMLLLD